MNPKSFQFLKALTARECGLILDDQKTYLAETRLAPVARQFGHADIDKLIDNVMATRSRDAVKAIVEAMVTNETFFFRDKGPFDHFEQTALKALLPARAKERQLNIWSAAASTGQEAYSLAMILGKQAAALNSWRLRILGTDISEQALARARMAEYSQFEVQRGLPVKLLIQHFDQKGERWQLKPETKRAVTFEKFNLLDDPGRLGRFDVVFCRNVLIYFDVPLKKKILAGIAKQMNPGGYLYLGGAESIIGLSDAFAADRTGRGVYTLKPAATAAVPRQALAG